MRSTFSFAFSSPFRSPPPLVSRFRIFAIHTLQTYSHRNPVKWKPTKIHQIRKTNRYALSNKSKSKCLSLVGERLKQQRPNKRIKPISQDKQPTFLRFFHFQTIFIYFHYNFFSLSFQFAYVRAFFTRFIPFNPFQLFFFFRVLFHSSSFALCLFTFIRAFGSAREKVSSSQKMLLIFCNYLLFITFSRVVLIRINAEN